MPTDIVMPQLGESIAEGTIVRWLKKVGDTVAKDEPLYEISTDKVDAEIPSPAAGVLLEIKAQEGETVSVNSVVGSIGEAGEAPASAAPAATASAPAPAAPAPPPAPAAPPAPPAPSAPAASSGGGGGAATDVVLPQLGESIAEGTIVRWLKKVGENVGKDEPLYEISTDKVDAEIPSPAAGVLLEILAQEGETVGVNSVVARVGQPGAAAAAPAPAAQPAAPATNGQSAQSAPPPPSAPAPVPSVSTGGVPSVEELRRTKSSPVVRNIAKEHNINIAEVPGTGISGRVTKQDILGYIQNPPARPAAPALTVAPAAPAAPAVPAPVAAPPAAPKPSFAPGERVKVEQMSVMRKKIAEHMILSRRTSAHVTTFFEVDFTKIAKLRDRVKKSFEERNGTKITFLPFIIKATTDALKAFPIVNASLDGDSVVYKQDINLGIAVALDWGLIVPVIKQADMLSLAGLARASQDLAARARGKQLKPDEVAGGTFSITNFGLYGGLTATPIINQPQVAILGIGGITKRPWVLETEAGDVIGIRQIGVLSLSFDHRIIDGAIADQFMAHIKKALETTDFTALV